MTPVLGRGHVKVPKSKPPQVARKRHNFLEIKVGCFFLELVEGLGIGACMPKDLYP